MNERPSTNRLRDALHNVNIAELEEAADELGRQAVAVALATPEPTPAAPRRFEPTEEEERQRLLDAALADAIEAVARHRARVGRRTCIQADGKAVRLIFETLRGMQIETSDPGFPS